MRRYRLDLWILLGFLALPLLLYGPVTLGGRTMIPADNLYQWAPWTAVADQFDVTTPQNSLITDLVIQNYAWKRFAVDSLRGGEIPLWNPYLFAGAPFLANGQHSMLYPFSWLFFVLPAARAYGWYTLSQLWLAGALMYVLGRVLGMRRGSAALAGLVYQGSGFMLTSAAVFPMIIGAAAWLPLLLACIEKVAAPKDAGGSSKTLLWTGLGAAALGLSILAGHIEITYYTLVVMAGFATWRVVGGAWRIKAVWRPAGWLATMVALGLLLGGVQLIPFYEVGQVNFRQGASTFEQVRGYAFPLRRVLTLALPNFFGNPAHHSAIDAFTLARAPFSVDAMGNPNPTSEWGIKNYVEGGVYLGILPLLLALLGFAHGLRARARRGHTLFFSGLSLLSLAFIFGTPLYALVYYGLPFANQLNTPFRWVFPLSLCVAALAGFGADGLRARTQPAFQALIARLAVVGGLAVLGGLLLSRAAYGRFEPLVTRLFNNLALANTAFANAREFYSYIFWQLLILGGLLVGAGLLLAWAARRAPQMRRLWLPAACALLVADLALANWGFNAAVDPALLDHQPQLVQWLQAQPGPWRLTTFNPQGDKPLNANTPWLFDLQDVRGYDSIIPRQYTEFMAAIEPQNELQFNRVQPVTGWEALNSPLLDVLNVRFVITAATIDLPKFSLAWEGEGLRVYENLAAAPRAYTLPLTATAVADDPLAALTERDPRRFAVVEAGALDAATGPPQPADYAPAAITEYRNVQVVVETAVADPSWLILNDSYFPGWKAFVRPQGSDESTEVEAPIVRVNGNFRGVALEPGAWTVRFRYSPASFWLGGLASAMGVLTLLFATAVWGWRRLYRPQGALTTTRSIAKNSALPMALNLFNRLIDFVFAMYYLRVLGPADAGRFATAIAAAGFFEILSNFGLDLLLIREVSQDKQRANHYLFNTTLLRLGAAVVASLPVGLFVASTQLGANPLSTGEVAAIGFIMLGMLFSGMSKGVTGLFYVHEEAETPAAMTTATTILKVGLGVIVLLLGYGFVGLAANSILVNVVTLAALVTLALRRFQLRGPWRVDWPLQRELLRKGYPLMLIHLLQTVFISIDILILRLLLANGEEVVGWYQNAYKWFNALQIIPSFFTLALFPIISREIQTSLDGARRMYRLSLKLMLLLALPIAAATTFLAEALVTLLAGSQYLPHGAIALRIVMWSIPLGWMNSVTNYVLIALGLERRQMRAFAVAVVFNVVANLLFIPAYSYVAASVTTILSELVLLGMFMVYLRQRMPGLNWLQMAWRPVVVTAVMLAAMWLGNQVHLVVALLLGAVVYPAGLLLLRVFGPEERRVLADILPASVAARLRIV